MTAGSFVEMTGLSVAHVPTFSILMEPTWVVAPNDQQPDLFLKLVVMEDIRPMSLPSAWLTSNCLVSGRGSATLSGESWQSN